MSYPTQFEEMRRRLPEQDNKKHTCRGQCFCTGRCRYTQEEWDRLQDYRRAAYRFTGVDEMIFNFGD